MKGLVSPGTLFEELGYNYIGPLDGHDLDLLLETLSNLKTLSEPILLHLITQKGRGFNAAEEDPVKYHALGKLEPEKVPEKIIEELPAPGSEESLSRKKGPKYQDVFGQWLCDMAADDDRLIGITPAMREGSGMVRFSVDFPDRYHDVGIAEQHAVTLAAGMACEGLKPVVAIYSTFLQRGYDQLIHDVALQNLDVTFALDRAGPVGEDGATHAGAFDISYLRCIPNILVLTPSDENETRQALYTAYMYPGPAAVRYPRGTGPNNPISEQMQALATGRGRIIKEGARVALLNFGTTLQASLEAAEKTGATVADMRFAKPIDENLVAELADSHDYLITLEENVIAGGAGSAVLEFCSRTGIRTPVITLGLPDHFQDQAPRNDLLDQAGLSPEKIIRTIQKIDSPSHK